MPDVYATIAQQPDVLVERLANDGSFFAYVGDLTMIARRPRGRTIGAGNEAPGLRCVLVADPDALLLDALRAGDEVASAAIRAVADGGRVTSAPAPVRAGPATGPLSGDPCATDRPDPEVPMDDIAALVAERDVTGLQAVLAPLATSAITDELVRLSPVEMAIVFRLLPKDRALRVFEKLEPARQAALLDALTTEEVTDVIERLDPDDRVRLLDEMPAAVAARLLDQISPDEHQRTAVLLGYRPERAGRIMTPEYTSIVAGMTAGEAIERLRRSAAPGTIDVLYVVDDTRRLTGVVSLADLVLADPGTEVSALVQDEVISASTDEHQEVVARRLADNDLLAVPVLDREGRLVGVVTVDDALDVLEREDTEDVERIGGASPLDEPYLSARVLRVFRARVGWLLVLFVAEALTGTIIRAFEESLEAAVALAFFIPLLIGTGGNAGSQTVSTIVRAMAVGEVRLSDLARVVSKEARVGVLLGLAMAAVGIVRAFTLRSGAELAVVVGLALISVVVLATLVGSLLPLVLKQLRVDPAVVSAPFITTFVDGTGLLIYFSFARLIMGV